MLPAGTVLQGRYRIERMVGRGGMGAVYLAVDDKLGDKRVAVKSMVVPINDPGLREKAIQQFEREARLLATLDHPGLVDVTDYFEENEEQYLVMAYIDGQTLKQVVSDTPASLATALDWMDQIFAVLEYLHSHTPPILFRDLKPSNVMIDVHGRIRLIDFGIARVFDSSQTTTFLRSTGTPGYAPIEQWSGDTDPRADVYAAGATLYTLVTGKVPASALDRTLQLGDLVPPSEVNPALPGEFDHVVAHLMMLAPAARCATVAEARQLVRQAGAGPLVARYQPLPAAPEEKLVPDSGILPIAWALEEESAPETAILQDTSTQEVALTPGTVLDGRFIVQKLLGGGHSGLVYLARTDLRTVAIKVIDRSFSSAVERDLVLEALRQQASLMSGLSHAGLVKVNEFFVRGSQACLVMDYVEGVTLQRLLARLDAPLPVPLALQLIEQVCDVLEFLHGHKPPIVFRDLKPANVMIGAGGRCVLLDFAMAQNSGATSTPLAAAASPYCAIEQIQGNSAITPTTDMYSLGALAWSIFTRSIPPSAADLASDPSLLPPPHDFNPHLPRRLGVALGKLMRMDPRDRCSNIEMARECLSWAFEPEEAPPAPAAPTPVAVAVALPRPLASHAVKSDRATACLVEDPAEPVGLLQISPQGLVLDCARRFQPQSRVPLTVRISFPGGAAQACDVNAVIEQAVPMGADRWRYRTRLEGRLPAEWRRLLPSAGTERRLARRYPHFFQLLLVSNGQKALGVDVSLHGVGMQTAYQLPPDEKVELELQFDIEGREPLRLRMEAAPVHCAPQDARSFRIGLHITRITPAVADTLHRYLRSLP